MSGCVWTRTLLVFVGGITKSVEDVITVSTMIWTLWKFVTVLGVGLTMSCRLYDNIRMWILTMSRVSPLRLMKVSELTILVGLSAL